MRFTTLTGAHVGVVATRDELRMLSGALNEVVNGVHIADFEFQTRLGWDREVLRLRLREIHDFLTGSRQQSGADSMK